VVSSGVDCSKASLLTSIICIQYRSFIRKIIRRRIKDRYQADDVFQNVFLHLLSSPMPTDTDDIERHLYRTTNNCITSNKRQTSCEQRHLYRHAETVGVIETQKDPQDILIVAEETVTMFSLIRKQLSEKEGQAITLRYLNDCDLCEIAEAMNVKTASAERYIARGLGRLRSTLTQEEVSASCG
jgi:RNA polymerase sigma factor (sigma-70 family)